MHRAIGAGSSSGSRELPQASNHRRAKTEGPAHLGRGSLLGPHGAPLVFGGGDEHDGEARASSHKLVLDLCAVSVWRAGRRVRCSAPSTAVQPPHPHIKAQKSAVQQALSSPALRSRSPRTIIAPSPRAWLYSHTSLGIHMEEVLETGCRARWTFALNSPRWAQARLKTRQAQGLTRVGNSHYKLTAGNVSKEFSMSPPSLPSSRGKQVALWPKPLPF